MNIMEPDPESASVTIKFFPKSNLTCSRNLVAFVIYMDLLLGYINKLIKLIASCDGCHA